MCGIGGIALSEKTDLNLYRHLNKIIEIQNHRGPDSNGIWISPNEMTGLCHNRLSIVDLSRSGNQPMHTSPQGYSIVFNGEIYNYLELKKELTSKGIYFKSKSDTEVVLNSFIYWGEEMLDKLRGMFSFVIYNSLENLLFCARDRIGKKPFIYSQFKYGFVFGSEIPAVRSVVFSESSYNNCAISSMLLHNMRHIPDPYTAYNNIKRLRAGHAMYVKDGIVTRIWRYWKPTKVDTEINSQQLLELLEECVRVRMRADVPVGALLSGGIDSSAIVSLMRRNSNSQINTYALGFDENDEDLVRARFVSNKFKTSHKEFYFEQNEQWEIYNQLIKIYGEPIALLPLVHAYILCRNIRKDGIKVVLTGNGADELFYGYTGHTRTMVVSKWLKRVSPFLKLLAPLRGTCLGWVTEKPGNRKASYYSLRSTSFWNMCLSDDAINSIDNLVPDEMAYWGNISPSKDFIDESNFIGLMLENTHSVTTASDLPAMANSTEMRAPFLDQDMTAFAFTTDSVLKIPDSNNKNWLKAILRDAVKDIIPKPILNAPKRGFGYGIKEDYLLKNSWKKNAISSFENPVDLGGLFDTRKIQNIWANYLEGKCSASFVMKILSIQIWAKSMVN